LAEGEDFESGIASTAKEDSDGEKKERMIASTKHPFNTPQGSFAGPTLRNRKLLISSDHRLLSTDKTLEVVRMAPDEVCEHDMLVLVRWQGRTMAAPLAQLTAVDPDESTAEAVGDWHYWVAQGYCL
jgi:hypothetical protein